jgi:hypothetical protein
MSRPTELAEILRAAPRNCWLALDEEETRVVAHGKTPDEAAEQAQQNGVEEPVLIWAPEKWTARVF